MLKTEFRDRYNTKSSKSGGLVSQRVQLFSISKGGLCKSGFKILHPRNADFSKVKYTEFQILVSGVYQFKTNFCDVWFGSECARPAKRQWHGKTNNKIRGILIIGQELCYTWWKNIIQGQK
jgi:hypothetical protein